jgi:microcystin-dependent protein
MEQYIGQIKLFGGNFAPKDWAFCDGQLLKISQNTDLFRILGTSYGGDGKTNFALPDLRGAAVVHPDQTKPLGSKGGDASKQFAADNFPPHTHVVTANIKSNSKVGTQFTPVGNYPANSNGFDREYHDLDDGRLMAANAIVGTVSNEGTTTPTPVSNMQPYLAVNFIIALKGELPPRP